MRRRDVLTLGLAAACAGATTATTPAFGQAAYPSRPIHVIVPSSAGGVHDIIARIWAERVKTSLGNVIVENRGGGGSSIALNCGRPVAGRRLHAADRQYQHAGAARGLIQPRL